MVILLGLWSDNPVKAKVQLNLTDVIALKLDKDLGGVYLKYM